MGQLISQGAEAKLYKEDGKLIKERIKKSYRHSILDEKLRKIRTRKEAKLLSLVSFSPKLLSVNDRTMKIEMEFINGKLLKDVLDDLTKPQQQEVCKKIAQNIQELHEKDIIHGDLTTSNMILKGNRLYFIDFGLGYNSGKIEDKATDLKLLKQALDSKHYKHSEFLFKEISKNYKINEVKERLKKVEQRGRYKRKTKRNL